MHHLCITTKTYQESLNFYTNIFGFKVLKETKDFNSREYNTWLELNGMKIELQTPKASQEATAFSKESLGISHCAFLVENIEQFYASVIKKGYTKFKRKNNEIIYWVCNQKLMKIIAPEGTIIEIRENDIGGEGVC